MTSAVIVASAQVLGLLQQLGWLQWNLIGAGPTRVISVIVLHTQKQLQKKCCVRMILGEKKGGNI